MLKPHLLVVLALIAGLLASPVSAAQTPWEQAFAEQGPITQAASGQVQATANAAFSVGGTAEQYGRSVVGTTGAAAVSTAAAALALAGATQGSGQALAGSAERIAQATAQYILDTIMAWYNVIYPLLDPAVRFAESAIEQVLELAGPIAALVLALVDQATATLDDTVDEANLLVAAIIYTLTNPCSWGIWTTANTPCPIQ